jgi:polyisoprenoid-binding protein YceI
MRKTLGILAVAAALATQGFAADTKFALDGDNTKITFVGTKKGGKHDGGFKTVTGTATVDPADLTTAKFEVDIDMTSLYTDTDKLTAHLKSPDFFGVKANPKGKFVSTKVEKKGDDYVVTGDLTMNGKTKSVSFPAKLAVEGDKLTLTSDLKINRHDWGVSFGKGMVDDDVAVKLAVSAKK